MGIEISGAEAQRALAELRRVDPDSADGAKVAVESLTWRESDDEPVVVNQYRLQQFLWYELTHKWMAPPDELRDVARALAAFFDQVGASQYAAICRSPETERMIATEGDGWTDLVEASGLEPPDTLVLEWGPLMGVEEAELRDKLAVFLEGTIDRGELVPGAAGWRDRQEVLTELFLATPNLDGVTPLQLIHGERIDRWLGHPSDTTRRKILEPSLPLITAPRPDDDQARLAIEPLLWLLGRLDAGVALTQTGAFSRQFVREAVERYPRWWRIDLFDPPNREAEVLAVEALHDIVKGLKLARRRGRTLHATKRAHPIRNHPTILLEGLVAQIAKGEEPVPGGVDVTLALMLRQPPLTNAALRTRITRAVRLPHMLDETRFRQILPHMLLGYVAGTLAPFDGIELAPDGLPTLTEAGRIVAIEILRARATGPVRMLL